MKPCCWVVVIYLSFGLPCESFYRVELRDKAPRAIFDSIPFVSDAANIAGNIAGKVSSGVSGAVQGITNDVKDAVSKVSSGVGNAIDTVASGFAQHPNNNTLESGESTTIRTEATSGESTTISTEATSGESTTISTEATSGESTTISTEASTATIVNVANDDHVVPMTSEKLEDTTKQNNGEPSKPNNIFDVIGSIISNPIGAIQKGINNTVEAVKSGIGNAVAVIKSGAINAVKSGISKTVNVVEPVESWVDRVMDTIRPKPPEGQRSWFDNTIGFLYGMGDKTYEIIRAFVNFFLNILRFLQNSLKVAV